MLDSAVHPWWDKQKVVVNRLISLGLRSLAEKTVKMAAALLLCTVNNVPEDAELLYNMVQDFKTCFSTTEPNKLLAQCHLLVYPGQPNALPADVFRAAYDANDPPSGRDMPQLMHLASLVPLRSTNKKLASKQKKQQASAQRRNFEMYQQAETNRLRKLSMYVAALAKTAAKLPQPQPEEGVKKDKEAPQEAPPEERHKTRLEERMEKDKRDLGDLRVYRRRRQGKYAQESEEREEPDPPMGVIQGTYRSVQKGKPEEPGKGKEGKGKEEEGKSRDKGKRGKSKDKK